jgi:hypothetical protein
MRIGLLAAVASVTVLIAADVPRDPARAYLTASFGLSRADVERLDTGQVVSRTLDTDQAREVATLGIVRIAMTPEKYVEYLTDIAAFKRTEDVIQIGTFSDPPKSADVAALTLDEGDLKRLQACRVDDCDVRLSAEGIQQFGKAVNWRAADAPTRATDVMRQLLVDYVARYRQNGATALMTYADRSPRLDLRSEFAALVADDQSRWRHLDGLRRHILEYPHDRVAATDMIYWSKERVSKRPVISVTHLSIMRQTGDSPVRFAIGSKQIYAMHYFDASLGVTLLVPDPSSPSPATFVVYLNRSRVDLFDGMLGRVARRVASGRARSLVATQLSRLQRTLGS